MIDTLPFTKFQGAGNDFVIIDGRPSRAAADLDLPALARRVCDRHYGVGADGLLVASEPATVSPAGHMRMFNPDGSESEMCGNGLRCFARWLHDLGDLRGDTAEIETGAGVFRVELHEDGTVSASMGEPQVQEHDLLLVPPVVEWPATVVSMGNPHAVFFVPDVSVLALGEVGPRVEEHPAFPKRTNAEFVQVLTPDRLRVRVWERGAGATLACGTGACAAHAAARAHGHAAERATLELPGGILTVTWPGPGAESVLSGPAVRVFDGTWPLGLLPALRGERVK